MKKKFLISLPVSALFLFISSGVTYAVCPVCTVAVVAGLGLSRYLGIDDTISGVWIGGLILSISFWLKEWLLKKNVKSKYLLPIAIIINYLLIFIPLQLTHVTGHPLNTLLGIDKLFLGSIIGSSAFSVGVLLDKLQRKIKGKHLFAFQKVVFPVTALIIVSIIFASITRK